MTAGSDRLVLLHAYRDTARQLVDLLGQEDELIDMDALEGLLAERDRLIACWNEAGGGLMNDEERAVAASIQQLDRIAMAAMVDKQQKTRERSSGFQTQRRGLAAYSGEYAYDAAFIDKRK